VQKNGKICVPTSRYKKLRVGSDRSVAVLRHLLTYTDGAVILDAQARAIGVGAQLKTKAPIEARAGTRHTSAQRFSYDFAKGIIFVVSSDGPVTFSPTA